MLNHAANFSTKSEVEQKVSNSCSEQEVNHILEVGERNRKTRTLETPEEKNQVKLVLQENTYT